jgi:uncharacterized protein (DUF2267 family)
LREISNYLDWGDRSRAYQALRAVLHAIRDRLPVEEAAHLRAELPMLARGFYYESWKPSATPVKIKALHEFYDLVASNCAAADPNVNPLRATEAVMHVLREHLSGDEIDNLRGVFPQELQVIWRAPSAVATTAEARR